jgi:hypothetical protein
MAKSREYGLRELDQTDGPRYVTPSLKSTVPTGRIGAI